MEVEPLAVEFQINFASSLQECEQVCVMVCVSLFCGITCAGDQYGISGLPRRLSHRVVHGACIQIPLGQHWLQMASVDSASFVEPYLVKPILASSVVKTLALLSFGRTSSSVDIWYFGGHTALFRSFGFRQILIFPGLATTTILLIQSVGSVSFTMIFFFASSCNLALTSLWSVTAMRRGAWCTGLTSGSTVRLALQCSRDLQRHLCSLVKSFPCWGLSGFHICCLLVVLGCNLSSTIIEFRG